MADNITPNATTSPASYVFAADEVGADAGKPILVPRVKIQHGGDGSAADASAANPLPVVDSAAVAALQTMLTQTDGVEAALVAVVAAIEALPDSQGLTDTQLRAQALLVKPQGGTLTDRSGTITTGGTAQQVMAANSARQGFSIQNLSTGDLWINPLGTAAAAQPSIKLAAGVYFEAPLGYGAVGAISIFGTTTGQAFSAKEY
jgi:hypothetical protein